MKYPYMVLGLVLLLGATQSASALPEDKIRVHFIDVGQGAATLVEFACGAILIDAGGERWPSEEQLPARYDSNVALYSYLNWFFNHRQDLNRRLDALFITHPHKDHTRGIPIVLEEFGPRNIIHNGQRHESSGSLEQELARDYARQHGEEGVRSWYVLEDHATASGGLTNSIIDPLDCTTGADGTDPEIRVLWGQVRDSSGWEPGDFDDENNHSLVIRIDFEEASILFTGDLEEKHPNGRDDAGIERLIRKYSGPNGSGLLDTDVFHVGHHGSHNGNSTALTQAVSPAIAVLASGPACPRPGFSAWEHAHPRRETIDELLPHITGTRNEITFSFFERHRAAPSPRQTTKAFYGTGWDGTIVLESGPDGVWREVSLSGPDLCLR